MCIFIFWARYNSICKTNPNIERRVEIMSTVIRVEKNQNFTVMSNQFLRNKELSLKAKGLLAVCLSLPPTWEYSMKGLVAICKESITSVRNTMKELEEHGYMQVHKLKNDKGQFYYEYVILEEPEHQKPVTGNLDIGNVDVGKAGVENVSQLNTNQLRTKELKTNKLNLYILDERLSPDISKLFKEYLEVREEIKKPVTERGLQTLLNRLEDLSNNNTQIQRMMLENAIINKWGNIFRPTDAEIEAASKALVESLRSFYGL